MNAARLLFAVASVGLAGISAAATPAQALTRIHQFAFKDAGGAVLGNGDFAYDDAGPTVIAGGDLSAFTLAANGFHYDLAFVQSLSGNPGAYVHFGYDRAGNRFTVANIPGSVGPYSGILAAVNGALNDGFFFDPLPGSADPAGTGADGVFATYNNGQRNVLASSYTISAVPEPGVWLSGLIGFAIVGLSLRRPRMTMVAA